MRSRGCSGIGKPKSHKSNQIVQFLICIKYKKRESWKFQQREFGTQFELLKYSSKYLYVHSSQSPFY